MFWIEKYRPTTFEEVRGQEAVIKRVALCAESRSVPHLLFIGSHGTGKSVVIECLGHALYEENWDANTTSLEIGEIFSQGKTLLERDERYSHIYKKSASLTENLKKIVKEYASTRPLDAEFKLMVFEDADVLPRDAQQALRRIMERYTPTCRFIFTTSHQSAIIPAVASRCLPLFFTKIPHEIISDQLSFIRKSEGADLSCPDDLLDLIAVTAQGDMRKAILLLQVAVETGKRGEDLFSLIESETSQISENLFHALMQGDLQSALRSSEILITDHGLTSEKICDDLRLQIKSYYNDPALAIILGEYEMRLHHSKNEHIHISALISQLYGLLREKAREPSLR